MVASRIRSLVLLPALLALLGAGAHASIPTPGDGTPIEFKVGLTFGIKLSNANGCTFDYEFTTSDPDIVEISNGTGTGVKKATIELFGKKAGKTMVFAQSFNGTCPTAMFAWPVTVGPNLDFVADEFADLTKAGLSGVKADIKVGLKTYADALKGFNVEYKAGNLDDEGLHDAYHGAADLLRKGITLSATLAYTNVILGGSELLDSNGLEFGEAPIGMFAGGCEDYDDFQDGVCGNFAKFHSSFDKASKKGAVAFEKSGAPRMGQWTVLPPFYAGGPVYPNQLGSILPPQPLLGPLTITTLPVTNVSSDNGRLRVSGMGDSARSGQLEVKLTWSIDGDPPTEFLLTPDIVANEWTGTFGNLSEGAYTLETKYTGDTYGVRIPIAIHADF